MFSPSDSSESVDPPLFTPWSGSLHVLLILLGLVFPLPSHPSPAQAPSYCAERPTRLFDSLFDLPGGLEGRSRAPTSASCEGPRATPVARRSHLPAPWGLLGLAVRAGLPLNSILTRLLFRLSPHPGSLGQTTNATDF